MTIPPDKFRSWLLPLYVFIGVVLWDATVLLFDLFLMLNGIETITELTYYHPVLAIPMILTQVIGMIGLGLHLLVKVRE